MGHFNSFSINGRLNPKTVRIQVGDPIGPATFARDTAKPFTRTGFGVESTTREAAQTFPPSTRNPVR